MIADAAPVTAWRWNNYLLLPTQRRLLHCGEPVEQEDRVFDLLVLLLQNRERAVDRQEIITAIWGRRPVGDATLRQLVYKARRAVGDDGVHQTTIHTLYGRSLQWVAPVERVFEPEPGTAAPEEDDPSCAPADSAAPGPLPVEIAPPSPGIVRPPARRFAINSRFLRAGSMIAVLTVVSVVFVAGSSNGRWRPAAGPLPTSALAKASAPVVTPVPAAAGHVTIAVLPFVGMDATGDSYLTDGLTEELIGRLGRFPNLRVAARTSSFVFRDKAVDIREAARVLGVANILEGSVQRSGDRLRVWVALVSAKDGYQLWSAEYDPAAGDILKVEDEIATAVITQLHPELGASALAVLHGMHQRPPTDPAAHNFYLVGLQYLNRRTVPDIQRALGYFKRSVLVDPGYAPGWSGVASAYNLLREHNSDNPPDTYYAEGLHAANKAVALDPQLARAHLVLASLHEAHWEWGAAKQEFETALKLDPSDPIAHQRYGAFQWYMRDPKTALAQMRLARDLDPLSPIINTELARTLLFDKQVDAAITQYQVTLKLDPGFALCHLLLAQADMVNNRFTDGVKEARTAIALIPSPPPASYISVYGIALYFSGDKAGAQRQLQILEARSRQHYVSGVSLALLQAQVGNRDEMFANLARAVADHDALMRPAVASRAAAWYGDPRFKVLLVKMGLPTKY